MNLKASALCVASLCGSLLLSLSPACGKQRMAANRGNSLQETATAQTPDALTATNSTPSPQQQTSQKPSATPTPQPSPSWGTFTLDDPTATERINEGIDESVDGMLVGKDEARKALNEANLPPPGQITISVTPTEVTISSDVVGSLRTPANGTPIDWTWKEHKYKVSTKWENGKLVRSFKGRGRSRVNTYGLSPNGKTLIMSVRATGGVIFAKIKPLVYELAYKRTSIEP